MNKGAFLFHKKLRSCRRVVAASSRVPILPRLLRAANLSVIVSKVLSTKECGM
ncbi:MAG TPA: hypothetical protein VK400_16830 [Pyrinomonadaceae bacterium]|nr:hypothetical protein [Pyrinomonadaceae bacterium]